MPRVFILARTIGDPPRTYANRDVLLLTEQQQGRGMSQRRLIANHRHGVAVIRPAGGNQYLRGSCTCAQLIDCMKFSTQRFGSFARTARGVHQYVSGIEQALFRPLAHARCLLAAFTGQITAESASLSFFTGGASAWRQRMRYIAGIFRWCITSS